MKSFRYKAFISYSHQDESWARWVNEEIRQFRSLGREHRLYALTNGKPYANINGAGNMMDIQNKNCHAYEVHYRLILEDSAGIEKYVHPIIANRGTN